MLKRKYYIYVAFRPWDGSPCYVGKGQRDRWRVHLRKSHNSHLQRIIAKAGGEIPIVIIRSNLTEPEAFEIEIALIAAIGRGKNGPLVNQTDGGEGVSGRKVSAKTIRALIARSKGNKYGIGHRGAVHSLEFRAASSARVKLNPPFLGRKHSDETKQVMRLAKLNKKRDPLAVEKTTLKNKGRKRTQEICQAISTRRRGVKLSDAHCQSISIALTGRQLSADHRRNISVGHAIKRWKRECPVFPSAFAQWGDGASAGLLSCV
jgi:hypothetical protein